MPSIIRQLRLERCKTPLVISLEKDCPESAISVDLVFGVMIVIKSTAPVLDIGLSLAHEMIHFKQMSSGKLRTFNGERYWSGKHYSKDMPYLDLPWEIQAFSKQELIFRRALEEHNTCA